MNKIITIIGMIVTVFTVTGQVSDSTEMGSLYTNQVFYSLDNGEVSNVSNTDWDIAFSASGQGAAGSAILVNEATTTLWAYPGDTTEWSTFDTLGMSNWERLLNTDVSWTNGAFNVHRGAASGFDMGWGILNPSNNFWTFGDSLYLIKLSDDSFKKLWIYSLKQGVWEYKYADIDGGNAQTFTLDKSNYADRNFVYHSLLTDQIIDREPDNNTWDIMFTKHIDYISPPGVYVGVTSVFNNRNVWTAKANEVDHSTALSSTTPTTTFNQNINNIGREWKKFKNGSWTVYDTIAYFIYDNDSTDFYRVVFTDFGGSANGKSVFNIEKLGSVSVESLDDVITYSLYPNPASSSVTLLLDNPNNDAMDVQIVDLSGKVVYSENMQLQTGVNKKTIQLNNFKSGVYFLILNNKNVHSSQKLIIK